MSEFKREERFIVIKRKHLYSESRVHESLEQELRVWLDKHLIPTSECVVVESDWPEYEQIWRMIEARVTGQLSDYDRLEAENKELKAELEVELQRRWDGNEASSREHAEELKALRARAVVVVPERDSGGSYYEEGWNACLDELARLNGKTVSEADLRKWLELMEHGDFREGHCMCGSAVDSHGIYDGHAPTDAGEYYAGQVMEELRALLDEGKEDGNG